MKNTIILRRILIGGIFASLIIPFVVAKDLYFPFITGKAYFFRVLVEVLFAGWLILAIFDPSARPKKSCVLWSMISFLVIVLIANLQGTNPSSSFWSNFERMEGYVTLIHLFAYFLVLSSVLNTKKIWKAFLNVFVASTVAQSFWAVLQAAGVLETGALSERADGTFGNATYLAGFMMLGVFVTLYLWAKGSKNKNVKYFYISAIILQMVSIFYTATRGSLIAVIVGIFVSVLLFAILEPSKKHLRKILAGITVAIILFVTLVFGFKESAIVQETNSLRRLSEISMDSGTVLARFINWNISWNAVKERPLLGYGQGGYGEVFDKNYDVRMWNQEQFFDRVHNLFFDWLIAAGFLGLLSYLALLASAIYYIWKKGGEFSTVAKASFSGFFVGYFIHVMFVFDSLTTYIILFFVFAFIHSRVAKPIQFFEKINLSKNLSQVLVVAILIGTPFVVFGINAPSYSQNKSLIEGIKGVSVGEFENSLNKLEKSVNKESFGEQEVALQLASLSGQILRSPDVPDEIKQAYVNLTTSTLVRYLENNQNDSRMFFISGQFFGQMGDFDTSLKMFESATRISPNKQFMYQPVVAIFLRQGKEEEALALIKEVYKKNPDNDNIWVTYVEVALNIDDRALYNSLLEESLAQNKNNRVINFLERRVESDPDNPQMYASLAVAHYRSGDPEKAIQVLETLAEKFPEGKGQVDDLIKKIESGEGLL